MASIFMKKKHLKTPAALIPGDTIAILAPASPFDRDKFSQGIDVLEKMGFNIFLPPGLFSSKGYLAGDDFHRAELFYNVFKSEKIKAVMCARGGYGSTRILDKIDYESVCKNPKIFIGFSDISAILATLYQRCGMVTFHGPTVASLADAHQKTINTLFSALTSQKVFTLFEPKAMVLKPGVCKGPLIGGNLTTLCHLVGTDFEPSLEGHILFLEDCNEAPYRIDRMLTHMKMAGCFKKLAGMILGDFSGCGKPVEVIEVFDNIFYHCKFPMLAGIKIGHQKTNITLPIGIEATLNADEKYLCYHEPSTILPCFKKPVMIEPNKVSSVRKKRKKLSSDINNGGQIDHIMKSALNNFVFPGGVLLVAKNGSIIFHKAYGIANLLTDCPVTLDTVFDLASLTKPLATTTSIMALITDQKLALEDPLANLIKEFAYSDKENIRIDQLLAHTSGLPDYRPFFKQLEQYPHNTTKSHLRQMLLKVPLINPVGQKVLYSDLGFMILEWIIERITNLGIDQYVNDKIYVPLGLDNLFYQNVQDEKRDVKYAATEICAWRKMLMEGAVHDENAFVTGGIGGHAGLFGTALDVYRLLDHMLKIYSNPYFKGIFPAELVKKVLSRYGEMGRAMGFDIPSKKNSSSGRFFSCNSVGHLGFTGTSFWIDIKRSIVVIFLCNRIHPDRSNEKIKDFRPRLHDAIMYSLQD